MATIYFNKKTKKWHLNYIDPSTGKRVRKAISEYKSDAKSELIDLKYELKNVNKSDIIIKTNAIKFFENYRNHLSNIYNNKNTISRYENVMNRFIKFLDERYKKIFLNQIDSVMIREYMDCLKEDKKAERTINTDLYAISGSFGFAIDYHIIKENPVKEIKKLKEPSIPMLYWEEEECQRIISYFYNNFKPKDEGEYLGDIFTLLFNTGMRRNEIRFLLNKKDYLPDIGEYGVIHIRVKYLPNGEIWNPKWNIERKIPVNKSVYDIIQKYINKNKKLSLLFTKFNELDKIIPKNYLRNRLISTLKELDMFKPGFTLHTTRKSFATIMVNKPKVDIRAIQDILGHKSIETLMSYLHTSDQRKDYAINQIDIKRE